MFLLIIFFLIFIIKINGLKLKQQKEIIDLQNKKINEIIKEQDNINRLEENLNENNFKNLKNDFETLKNSLPPHIKIEMNFDKLMKNFLETEIGTEVLNGNDIYSFIDQFYKFINSKENNIIFIHHNYKYFASMTDKICHTFKYKTLNI